MPRTIPLLAAALLLVAQPLAAQSLEPRPLLDTLSIEAEGIYEAEPDLAVLFFYLFSQERELKRAYEKVTSSVQGLVELAQRHGVARQDITAGPFSVQPVYEGKNRPKSFYVATQITMKIRDLSKVGALLDETVQQGFVEFRSLEYRLANEEAAKQQAIAQASQRAAERAQAALGQNGRKLGALRIVNIDVRSSEPAPRTGTYRRYDPGQGFNEFAARTSEAALPPPPLPPTTPARIRVQATVKFLFQIE
jgi:uncharacterized protein YggE